MDDFEWSVLYESKLFEAMVGHKPVGINKYFQMACIWEKMQEFNIDVPSDKIWSHLETLYNLDALDDTESLPFPNEEREFYLPELEFGSMKVKKEEKIEDKTPKSNTSKQKETAKNTPAKEMKKDEKVINKKETPRRDSKDGKELKTNLIVKKEIKKETPDKSKQLKSRSSVNVKEDDKTKTPNRTEEALKRQNKRPTRGSMKPDDLNNSRKSQSPLTVTPTSVNKRRRL